MAVSYFWAAVVGFMAGVFVESFLSVGWVFALWLLLTALALIVFSPRNKKTQAILVAVFLIASVLGIFRLLIKDTGDDPTLTERIEQKVILDGVVAAEPDPRENSVRIVLNARSLTENGVLLPTDARVLIVAPLNTDIAYGNRVRAEGILRLPEAFVTDSGREFNYPAFLKKDGVRYELAFARLEVNGENEGNRFIRSILWIKQKYLEGLGRALPEPSAGLAGGITVGDKRALGSELSDTFRTAALIHIVVLSGYNIMIVINALTKMFRWAPIFVRFGIGILTALAFIVMTGGAAPSVRAAAMAVIGMAGRATRRTYLAMRALAFVSAGMVAWNPYMLPFDPGFQLSVAATWGIIALTPITKRWFTFCKFSPTLHEIIGTTTATQLAVLPLLLYQSGALPVYALPANILVLAVLPLGMMFSMIASAGGLFFGPLAPIIALPAHLVLSYTVAIATFFSHLPFAALTLGAFNTPWIFAAYGALFLYVWYEKRRGGV